MSCLPVHAEGRLKRTPHGDLPPLNLGSTGRRAGKSRRSVRPLPVLHLPADTGSLIASEHLAEAFYTVGKIYLSIGKIACVEKKLKYFFLCKQLVASGIPLATGERYRESEPGQVPLFSFNINGGLRMKRAVGVILAICLLPGAAAWGKVGGGDVTFTILGGKNVVYSHELHVTKLKMGCSGCHFRLFNTSRDNRVRMTMADMENGMSCGACHDGSLAFSVKGNCSQCHNGPGE